MRNLVLLPIVLLHLVLQQLQAGPYKCFIVSLHIEFTLISVTIKITVTKLSYSLQPWHFIHLIHENKITLIRHLHILFGASFLVLGYTIYTLRYGPSVLVVRHWTLVPKVSALRPPSSNAYFFACFSVWPKGNFVHVAITCITLWFRTHNKLVYSASHTHPINR